MDIVSPTVTVTSAAALLLRVARALLLLAVLVAVPAAAQGVTQSLSGVAYVEVSQELVITYSSQVSRPAALWYREYVTEFMGCLYGTRTITEEMDSTVISLLLPADMRPSQSEQQRVNGPVYCPDVPGVALLGRMHNHVEGLCYATMRVRSCGPSDEAWARMEPCRFSPGDVSGFSDLVRANKLWVDVLVCGFGTIVIRTASGAVAICHYNPEDTPGCKREPLGSPLGR